jgi:enoyl-CoA hydratase/carnithine racemase
MSTSPVIIERPAAGTCTIRLDRPDRLNLVDVEMRDALLDALQAIALDSTIRAVVIAAAGRHFSGGADLREFYGADDVFHARRIRWERDTWLPLWELRAPTIAALHGFAVGAGTELALLCDLRVAAPDTVMSLPECGLGMLPSAGGSQSITRTTGRGVAKRLVLTGERVDAVTALSMGLVDVIDDAPDARAHHMADRLATLPAETTIAVRRAIHAAADRRGVNRG